MEDHENGSDEEIDEYEPFTQKNKRQMEPLFVGDKIQYREPVQGWRTGKMLTATVTSINRKLRKIGLHTGDVVMKDGVIQRDYGYDLETKSMKTQRGVMRYVEDYDLHEHQPLRNNVRCDNYMDQIDEYKKIKLKHQGKMKRKLDELNIPAGMIDFVIDDKKKDNDEKNEKKKKKTAD